MTVYTLTVWDVTPEREQQFVEAWKALAQWANDARFDAPGTLVRDVTDNLRFVSFGPWSSGEEVARFRSHPHFERWAAPVHDEVIDSAPGLFALVAKVP